jgi:hypothetical protein
MILDSMFFMPVLANTPTIKTCMNILSRTKTNIDIRHSHIERQKTCHMLLGLSLSVIIIND